MIAASRFFVASGTIFKSVTSACCSFFSENIPIQVFRTDAPRPGDAWTASYTAPDIAAQVSVSFTSDLDRSQADAEALEPPALPAFVHRLVDND